MKKLKYISLVLIIFTFLVSCDNEASIQQFYVDSEEDSNYLMLDVPTSIVSLPETASAKSKQAYKSIDKVNLLAFKINDSNREEYKVEKTKVKKILKNPAYIELMRMNSNGNNIVAKYVGSEDSIEELIVFASNKEHGFALARILGDDMKPENMVELLNNVKDINKDSDVFSKVENFFKN